MLSNLLVEIRKHLSSKPKNSPFEPLHYTITGNGVVYRSPENYIRNPEVIAALKGFRQLQNNLSSENSK